MEPDRDPGEGLDVTGEEAPEDGGDARGIRDLDPRAGAQRPVCPGAERGETIEGDGDEDAILGGEAERADGGIERGHLEGSHAASSDQSHSVA
jgi:hypothetical protein